MPDINLLAIKMDSGNDPVFIAANIKNIEISNFIRGIERGFYIGKFTNDRDSMIFRHACSGSPAAEWIVEKVVRALLEITRIEPLYLNLSLSQIESHLFEAMISQSRM